MTPTAADNPPCPAEPGRPKRGRPKRPALEASQIVGTQIVEQLQRHLDHLHEHRQHPNRRLAYDTYLSAFLLAFYNPAVRSTRTLEDFSQLPPVRQILGIECLCRNSFSQASKLFDPALLLPLIRDLRNRVPELRHGDPKLDAILKKIVAADGSFFNIAADVAWALHQRKSNQAAHARVRLDFQLDVVRWLPQELCVSGQAQGSETAAQGQMLEAGIIYLVDRNYVDFEYLKAVLDIGSDFVLRVRRNAPNFVAEQDLPLSDQDRAHGVLSDRLGHLPGSAGHKAPPTQRLRELVIADPATGQAIRVLTSLLDLPAHLIGTLYRHRWQIELFFRWLKVWANFEHLISHSVNGVTMQFYVAVIGVLLMYAQTGRRPSRYAVGMLAAVASGMASLEQIVPILERREHERAVAKARLERKKAQKTQA